MEYDWSVRKVSSRMDWQVKIEDSIYKMQVLVPIIG